MRVRNCLQFWTRARNHARQSSMHGCLKCAPPFLKTVGGGVHEFMHLATTVSTKEGDRAVSIANAIGRTDCMAVVLRVWLVTLPNVWREQEDHDEFWILHAQRVCSLLRNECERCEFLTALFEWLYTRISIKETTQWPDGKYYAMKEAQDSGAFHLVQPRLVADTILSSVVSILPAQFANVHRIAIMAFWGIGKTLSACVRTMSDVMRLVRSPNFVGQINALHNTYRSHVMGTLVNAAGIRTNDDFQSLLGVIGKTQLMGSRRMAVTLKAWQRLNIKPLCDVVSMLDASGVMRADIESQLTIAEYVDACVWTPARETRRVHARKFLCRARSRGVKRKQQTTKQQK